MSDEANGWARLHPVTPLLRAFQLLYAFIIGVFAASLGRGAAVVIVVGFTLVAAAWITLSYLRFRYRVTDDGLIITRGVLFRKRRVIPRSRIQNVDLRAGLLQQLLRVTTARIETAGGQATEATLHVVSREEGLRLRARLVGLARQAPQAVPPTVAGEAAALPEQPVGPYPVPESALHRATPLQLAIAGATSNRAGVLVGALLGGDYLFNFMPTDRILGRFLPPEYVESGAAVQSLVETIQHDMGAFFVGVFVLGIFFGLAGWAVSVFASVIRYFDFTLRQFGNELQVSYGLLTRREKGFRRSRVQNVQIEEPILRRWLKLASVRVQTAGYGPGVKADERMETLAPIIRTSELTEYLHTVYPDFDWKTVEWRPAHPRARRRLFIRRALVVIAATAALTLATTPEGLLLAAALLPAWLLAHAHYRHLGHARAGTYVLVREGLWNRRIYIVPARKIQALHLRQSPFQRRLGLATLHIETAGDPLEWHSPRSIDLGTGYGLEMMEGLAMEVTRSGLTF
ncbi:MAG: PH domain-containing protein [Gemmatimonadota bacterium]|nr:MAG: PH domain-containing protein [Gemmatimonadota bacterium]